MAVTRRAIDGSVHMAVTWQRGPRDPRWRARRRRCSAAPQRSPGARARAPWRAPRRPRRLCRWRAAPWAASCLRLSWRRESRLLNATSTCERRLGATRGTTALTRGTYQQLHCLRVCGGNWHMSSFNSFSIAPEEAVAISSRPRGPHREQVAACHGTWRRVTAPRGASRRVTAPRGASRRLAAPRGASRRLAAPRGASRRLAAPHGASRRLAAPRGVSRRVKASAGVVNNGASRDSLFLTQRCAYAHGCASYAPLSHIALGRSRVLAGVTPRPPPCEPYP
jgi:hypothetical protein